eukprot:CAMPEP_0119327632 /NCGR_PEP_ID=MMETSP1333-20130426/71281_1 /TAXON_ID=418940 /ORGANISM="Scyphosphaera apsteinii, Strain RCC1455" /LENGTH=279 /DNA_ID=CAMNT_0007336273 /DNA_START=90 /DNA_END=926 /DNA_ORIENTATION=-
MGMVVALVSGLVHVHAHFNPTVSAICTTRHCVLGWSYGCARAPPLQLLQFVDPDFTPRFASEELARTWERAGKGKRTWQPGDVTDDPRDDARLLYSHWKLTPLQLLFPESANGDFCRTRLVLTQVGIPFECVQAPSSKLALRGEYGSLLGSNHDREDEIEGEQAICAFATRMGEGVLKPLRQISCISPATGRKDLAVWLAAAGGSNGDGEETAALLAQASQMIHSGTHGVPCLNMNGLFGVDDAAVLVCLHSMARKRGTRDWPAPVRRYLECHLDKLEW